MIKVTDIHKRFGDLEVLKGVSLDVARGEVVSIVGASGAGKTTLLQIVGTLSRPDGGRVEIDGQDVFSLGDKTLSRFRNGRIGFVFQFHHLLPEFTAFENVCIPGLIGKHPRAEVEGRAAELLEMMGLAGRRDHKPGQLSGGEQQRVAIARALITKPKLVFADEPTGNLDSVSSAEVLGFLKRSVNELGQTIVMVTHDAVAASYADRAIVFADGQIVADEANPTAETMNELLMAERERATRTAVTSTRADTLARLAGVKDVPNLPITDAPLPPAGRTGTMRHARAAAQHAR